MTPNTQAMIRIIKDAGVIAMDIYNSDKKEVSYKSDNSPLSNGDLLVNDFIIKELTKIDKNIPIVSEEIPLEDDYRTNLKTSWLIDPIDGTKAYIRKDHGEFTINIALIHDQRPIFGIVYAPYYDTIYYAHKGKGAYKLKNGTTQKLPLQEPYRTIYISKNHHSKATQQYIAKLEDIHGKFKKHPLNSSLKLCKVAEGAKCLYPKLGDTAEWDTAASDIILFESQSEIIDLTTNKPPLYNKKNILNNHFIARDKEYFQGDNIKE